MLSFLQLFAAAILVSNIKSRECSNVDFGRFFSIAAVRCDVDNETFLAQIQA